MSNFYYKPINNQDEYGSSAFMFDLRNSTSIIRQISWDERLTKHIEFMMKLHETVYETIYNNCDPKYFAMNDTGDGYLCVFWDELHALTCLNIAIKIHNFLKIQIPEHNKKLGIEENLLKFDYGFGLHSGASTIKRTTYDRDGEIIHKDFIFGIVPNTATRLESFTKNYIEYKFLVTGNYKSNFLKQTKNNKKLSNLFSDNKSLGRCNMKDGKKDGHIIYALIENFIISFKQYYTDILNSKLNL